jgi:hypothetical protein
VVADGVALQGDIRDSRTDTTQLSWTPFDARQAYLLGPHFKLALGAVATVGSLSAAQFSALGLFVVDLPHGSPLRAAPGDELVIVRAAEGPAFPSIDLSGQVDGVHLVVNGEQGKRLPQVGLSSKSQVLVISVPRDATLELAVADAGRTQTINLRTGATTDAEPLLHPPLSGGVELQDIIHISSPSGITPPGKGAYSVLRVSADLRPWLPEKGWAAPGRAWLDVQLDADVLADVEIQLDLAHCLALRTDAGLALPFTGTADSRFITSAPDEVRQVFDVPAGTRSLSAALVTRGTVTANGKTASWQRYPDPKSAGKISLVPPSF